MSFNTAKISSLAPNRRQLVKIALAGAATTVAGTSIASAASYHIRSVSDSYRQQDAQKLLTMINDFRAQNGLGALKHSSTVASVMESEAVRQFRQGYFSHGTKFLYDGNVQGYSFAREVIALSYNDDISQLLAFWKSSPAHRAAILAPEANTCGIGLCYGTGSGLPWRILGNVGIYRYTGGNGPNDIQSSISGSASADAFPIVGGIRTAYDRDGGADYYGQPIFAEKTGLVDGGAWQQFRSPSGKLFSIMWSPNTGGYAVQEYSGISSVWRPSGAENGFGYPVTNEYWYGSEIHQRFSNGKTIAWDSNTGNTRVF